MKAVITRENHSDKQIIGTFILRDDEGLKLFMCKTLELPWNENKRNESCIPLGNYKVSTRKSAKYNKHYHIEDVNGRSLILIHPGNYYSQTNGCILVGKSASDINKDGYLDVTNSRETMLKLLKAAPDGFELEVIKKAVKIKNEADI
jgi:hypothetical protein